MRRRVAAVGSGAAVAAIAGIFACRQAIGIDQYFNAPAAAGADARVDVDASACGLPYGTTACASCAATSCCSESLACATTSVCAPYEMCLGGCSGDAKCRAQCTADNLLGTSSEVSALSACVAAHCNMACGLTCGGLTDYLTPPDAAAACDTCVSAHACASALECASSAECDAHLRSFLACVTDDCRQAVASDSSPGAKVFATFQGNWSGTLLSPGTCAASCAVGSNWSCVGHVAWPPAPTSPTVTISAQVAEAAGNSPVAGAQVLLCALNCPCSANPYGGPWTTDSSGVVVMTARNPGGVGGTGCFQVTAGPNTEPLFFYPGFPVTEAMGTIGKPFMVVGTPGEFTQLAGVPLDPGHAVVGFGVVDCLGNPAPGVQVAVSASDSLTQVFYGLPSSPGLAATDSSAFGGVANVPVDAGSVVVTATPLVLGKAMGHVQVAVQAGAVTELVVLGPTP